MTLKYYDTAEVYVTTSKSNRGYVYENMISSIDFLRPGAPWNGKVKFNKMLNAIAHLQEDVLTSPSIWSNIYCF